MHPVLFRFKLPGGHELTAYSYGLIIAIDAFLGAAYFAYHFKKDNKLPYHVSANLITLIILAAVVGGKVFMLFEDASLLMEPRRWFASNGFVFYGSFVFAIASVYGFIKYHKLPLWPSLDIIAITTGIVHFIGRLGCFMAGCCHGTHYEGFGHVVFTDPHCAAPLNEPLYPTQLYSSAMIFGILFICYLIKQRKHFSGQVFLTYVILYAFGRSIIEEFRGDEARGYFIDDVISNAQFVSLLLIIAMIFLYRKRFLTTRPRK